MNLQELSTAGQEIAARTLALCHEKLGVPGDSTSTPQLMAVLNLALFTLGHLEGLIKVAMSPEERAAMRAFLDQFSERTTVLLNQATQTPDTGKEPTNG